MLFGGAIIDPWQSLLDGSLGASCESQTRVFKARYFPNCEILDVEIGNNPSYMWMGICDSKHILNNGVRFRVGNGNHVRVWQDPWLPCNENAFVTTKNILGLEGVTVENLMKGVKRE